MVITRRNFLRTASGLLVAAPMVVRAENLMQILQPWERMGAIVIPVWTGMEGPFSELRIPVPLRYLGREVLDVRCTDINGERTIAVHTLDGKLLGQVTGPAYGLGEAARLFHHGRVLTPWR